MACWLISQIQALLRHKSWDARVAAGECLGLIAEHAAHPSPADLASAAAAGSAVGSGETLTPMPALVQAPEAPASVAVGGAEDGALTLRGFDLARVLERGTQLLASGGQVERISAMSRAHLQFACRARLISTSDLP